MRSAPTLLLLLAVAVSGCTSKSKARARAQTAFASGQQHAFSQMAEARRTSIRVVGSVQNPEIPWREDLTLARVIVAAGYLGPRDPRQIVILRQREQIRVDARDLLRGHDWPVEPGDTIEIHP